MAFRHEFTPSVELASPALAIFADSRYSLWVNGARVADGPTRFDWREPTYDIVPIPGLMPGATNSFVLVAHNYVTCAFAGGVVGAAPALIPEVGRQAAVPCLCPRASLSWPSCRSAPSRTPTRGGSRRRPGASRTTRPGSPRRSTPTRPPEARRSSSRVRTGASATRRPTRRPPPRGAPSPTPSMAASTTGRQVRACSALAEGSPPRISPYVDCLLRIDRGLLQRPTSPSPVPLVMQRGWRLPLTTRPGPPLRP